MSGSESCQIGATGYRQAMDEILKLISSSRKLDRDLGARKLQHLLRRGSEDTASEEFSTEKRRIQDFILNVLGNSGANAILDTTVESNPNSSPNEWEIKHGCLLACYPLLDATTGVENYDFVRSVQLVTLKLLGEDPVKTVQLAAGMQLH